MSCIVDMPAEEWERYRADLTTRVKQIDIPKDVNPSVAINILAVIDEVYSTLRLDYADLESMKERIDMMVKEIERAGLTGKNEDERRKNSVQAVREYTIANGGPSLYDIQREANARYNFVKGALDVLINKQNRLITINGLLKIDKDLIVSQSSFSSMLSAAPH